MPWTTKARRDELRQNTPVPDLNKLPSDALMNDRQVSLLSGFSEYTLRVWRMKGKGPAVTYVEDRPRYKVSDYRAWVAGSSSSKRAA